MQVVLNKSIIWIFKMKKKKLYNTSNYTSNGEVI